MSLQLLVELKRKVFDLTGRTLLEGWQYEDIIKAIQYREDWTRRYLRWPHPYEFNRPQTPYPEELRRSEPELEAAVEAMRAKTAKTA